MKNTPHYSERSTEMLTALSNIHPISKGLSFLIQQHAREMIVPSGTLLVREGAHATQLYYIKKGMLRAFNTNKGREDTFWIITEGSFALSISGSYGPSKKNIEALEDTVLLVLEIQTLQRWSPYYSEVPMLLHRIMGSYFDQSVERAQVLSMDNALARYRYYQSSRPQQVQRAPLRYIASWIGVKERTLLSLLEKHRKHEEEVALGHRLDRVEEIIHREQLFKKQGLTLPELALTIGMPAYQLSQLLNQHCGKRFQDYINHFRVNYVIERYRNQGKTRKLSAIAKEAGFSSRTSLYDAFKKEKDMTPNAYLNAVTPGKILPPVSNQYSGIHLAV